jgi:hypothetical protein
MRLNPILNKFRKAAKTGEFFRFQYLKEGESVPTQRLVRFGGNIAKRMDKQSSPLKGQNGKGCWIDSAQKSGKNSMILRRDGKIYVRGTEIKKGESKHKCFLLSGITLK